MNKEKKGYGIVIPADWTVGKWDTLTPQDIIEQLKALTCDAFYRMSRAVDLDLDLLETSGYEYDGLSEIAVIELEAFLNAENFRKSVSVSLAQTLRKTMTSNMFFTAIMACTMP